MRELLWGLLAGVLLTGCRTAHLQIDGRTITATNERMSVVISDLAVTRIENKLTGEVLASGPDNRTPSPALANLLPARGILIESLRPDVPPRWYRIDDRTRIVSSGWGAARTIRYHGLTTGAGDAAVFDERLSVELRIGFDPATGDLVLTPNAYADIEEVHGVRDRGLLRCAIQVLNLDDRLTMIVPTNDGMAWSAETAPASWTDGQPATWRWPQSWEAALLIAESERGCLGVWADEPELNYLRELSVCRGANGWNVGLAYETTDRLYRCTAIGSASWRLNVYEGYWKAAAAAYQRQVMAGQWQMKPLAESTPAWADKIRLVIDTHVPAAATIEAYNRLVPRDTMISFTSQGWLQGWNTGEMHQVAADLFPNSPLDYPTHYQGVDGIADQFRALEALDCHVFPYTNATCISWQKHPWFKDKLNDMHFLAWRIWQRFYPELCQQLVAEYGVSGIYEDCSWVIGPHFEGEPDGMNWAQGSVAMREYFRELMPEVAIMGERNNEVTARGQQVALGWVLDSRHRHPICAYLFNPYVRRYNLFRGPEAYDANDIVGFMVDIWPASVASEPMQDQLMLRKRGELFAREQLVSHWPEVWEPGLMHAYRGQDGTEYRFVRDRGTRLVKLGPNGPETFYWRLQGVTEADAPDVGIQGWVGYDGNRIVGLNPHVPLYVTVGGVERPPAVITAVPDGFAIHRTLIRDGFWTVSLDAIDRLREEAEPGAPLLKVERHPQTIRVQSDRPLRFSGAEAVRELGDHAYAVTVALPGSFSVYWAEPVAIAPGQFLGELPARFSFHGRFDGLIYGYGGQVNTGARTITLPHGTVPRHEGRGGWLVTLPAAPMKLAFQYGTEHGYGDGANYQVRVNGEPLWQAYRRQTHQDPELQAKHVAPPIEEAAVDLSAFAGQTIVLELAIDGHRGGGSETIRWTRPRLEPAP